MTIGNSGPSGRDDLAYRVLSNGAEVVTRVAHSSPTVAVQVWVRVGSVDETPNQRGMAHFLEHMLFKGTSKRAVGEIAATVEACGGDINAFTTFEYTVYHLTLAAAHVGIGIELLADAIFDSSLDPVEVERERAVILEEIRRGNDQPGHRVGRQVFAMMFEGTEAARPIIGSEASVTAISAEDLRAFYKTWYRPDNLSVVVVGHVRSDEAMRLVESAFGAAKVPSMPLPWRESRGGSRADGSGPRAAVLRGDFQQPRLEVVFPAPSQGDSDAIPLDVAAFALGSGDLSRLNRTLRDKLGLAASTHASVYTPGFGGVFELSALPERATLLSCVTALAHEAFLLRSTAAPVTSDELARARVSLKADRVVRDETVEGQARTVGFGLQTAHKLFYDDVYSAVVNTMPIAAIAAAVERWFEPKRAVIVALVPQEDKLTEVELLAAFQQGWAHAAGSPAGDRRPALPVATSSEQGSPPVIVEQLSDSVKCLYRHDASARLFTLTLASVGGLRGEDAGTAGIHNATASMMALASTARPYLEHVGFVESRGASMEGFSGKDSIGFHLQCLAEEAADILGAFADSMVGPVFPAEQWTASKREIEQALVAQDDSPASVCMRRFQELIFGDHPYRFPLAGTLVSVESMTTERLLSFYRHRVQPGPWVLAANGPYAPATVLEMLKTAFCRSEIHGLTSVFAADALVGKGKGGALKIFKERQQCHIIHGFRGLTWSDQDRFALDVLVNVLGGHGGRLFRDLRDRDGLAYTVAPVVSYGVHPGAVGIYIACAPDKTVRSLAGLKEAVERLAEAGPSRDEMERAVQHIVGTHAMGLQRSEALTTTMALMELYGLGWEEHLMYPREISATTVAQVTNVARRLLAAPARAEVVVGPITK